LALRARRYLPRAELQQQQGNDFFATFLIKLAGFLLYRPNKSLNIYEKILSPPL
jgi:hypothetical protein